MRSPEILIPFFGGCSFEYCGIIPPVLRNYSMPQPTRRS
jgi:hypothetical protein